MECIQNAENSKYCISSNYCIISSNGVKVSTLKQFEDLYEINPAYSISSYIKKYNTYKFVFQFRYLGYP